MKLQEIVKGADCSHQGSLSSFLLARELRSKFQFAQNILGT